jgi:hypothetical protein
MQFSFYVEKFLPTLSIEYIKGIDGISVLARWAHPESRSSVNPIPTRGADYADHIPPDLKT